MSLVEWQTHVRDGEDDEPSSDLDRPNAGYAFIYHGTLRKRFSFGLPPHFQVKI